MSLCARAPVLLACLLVWPHAWNFSFAESTKGDWVYLIKLHLQDATGEVDAALFDKDADEFFQVKNLIFDSFCHVIRQCDIAFTVSTLNVLFDGVPHSNRPHAIKDQPYCNTPIPPPPRFPHQVHRKIPACTLHTSNCCHTELTGHMCNMFVWSMIALLPVCASSALTYKWTDCFAGMPCTGL